MGDRCYMSVTCRKDDAHLFEDLGFIDEQMPDLPPGIVNLVDEEANYAHCGDMPDTVPYFGTNSNGWDYGAGEFVCDGDEVFEVSISSDGYPFARLEEDGKIVKDDIKEYKEYRKALQKVLLLFGLEGGK